MERILREAYDMSEESRRTVARKAKKWRDAAKFRCPDKEYALLQKLRNDVIGLKADYSDLKNKRDHHWRVEGFDVADLLGGIFKRQINEI